MRGRWARAATVIAITVAAVVLPTASTATVPVTDLGRPLAKTAEGEATDALAAEAADSVADMTVAEQAASIVMGHIGGADPAALHAYMQQGLGGFILMGGNIPATDAELTALTDALTIDPALAPLIAVDQEGGIVSRLPGDVFPASTTLKAQPVPAAAAAFAARASLTARSGITVNFGTVADVTADPTSFIHGRALGTDPASAAERVAAVTGAQERVLASTLKHFPGHGAAPGDSHSGIPSTPMTLDEWRRTDAVPFIAGIDAGASIVMLGHLAYTAVDSAPATLSPAWHRILRDELGFEGVTVTDDLGMLLSSGVAAYADPVANAVTAVAAGNDLVLMIAGSTAATAGDIVAGITAAVDDGTVPAERLQEAATRVMSLRLELSRATTVWTVCDECEPVS